MATAVDSSFDSVDVSSQSESESAASFALDSEEEFLRVVDANVIHVEGGLDCCPATASCKNPVREDGRTRSHFHCPYVAKRPACPLVHGSRTRVADHVRSVHNDSAARARQRTKDARRSARSVGAAMRRAASRGQRASSALPSSSPGRGSMPDRRKRDAAASSLEDVSLLHRVPDDEFVFSRDNRFGVGRGSGAAKRSRSAVRVAGFIPMGEGRDALAGALRTTQVDKIPRVGEQVQVRPASGTVEARRQQF